MAYTLITRPHPSVLELNFVKELRDSSKGHHYATPNRGDPFELATGHALHLGAIHLSRIPKFGNAYNRKVDNKTDGRE